MGDVMGRAGGGGAGLLRGGPLSRRDGDVMGDVLGRQVAVVLGCFAAVGTWRFGSYREEFATISASLQEEVCVCMLVCVCVRARACLRV